MRQGLCSCFSMFSIGDVSLRRAVLSRTIDAIVAVLRLFIAKGGIPCQIVSDHATNFVGAKHDLIELDIQHYRMAFHSSSLTQLRQVLGNSGKVNETSLAKRNRGFVPHV